MVDVFLAKQPGPSYWFRKDRVEELRHLRMLMQSERAAKLAGINTRPRRIDEEKG